MGSSGAWAKTMWTLVILSVLSLVGFITITVVRACDRPRECEETSAVLESSTWGNGSHHVCTAGSHSVVEWNSSRVLVRCVCAVPQPATTHDGGRP